MLINMIGKRTSRCYRTHERKRTFAGPQPTVCLNGLFFFSLFNNKNAKYHPGIARVSFASMYITLLPWVERDEQAMLHEERERELVFDFVIRHELDVEVAEDGGRDGFHLEVSELLAQAETGPRVEHGVLEGGLRGEDAVPQPALRAILQTVFAQMDSILPML